MKKLSGRFIKLVLHSTGLLIIIAIYYFHSTYLKFKQPVHFSNGPESDYFVNIFSNSVFNGLFTLFLIISSLIFIYKSIALYI